MDRRRTRVISLSSVRSYAVVVSPQSRGCILEALHAILAGCTELGLMFQPPRQDLIVIHDPRDPRDPRANVEHTMLQALNASRHIFQQPPELIIWIFDRPGDQDYARFKAEGARRGIATQAVQVKNVTPRKATDFQFLINMTLKMNGKMRGLNHALVQNSLGGDRGVQGWLETHMAIVFGADLTHSEGRPSLATLAGSMNRIATSYADVTTVQGLVEPDVPGTPVWLQQTTSLACLGFLFFWLSNVFRWKGKEERDH